MTRYEELVNKANKCREKARKTKGKMQTIWLAHALALEEKARELLVKDVTD